MVDVTGPYGGIMAQLVARLLSMQKVFGSIPNYSIFFAFAHLRSYIHSFAWTKLAP